MPCVVVESHHRRENVHGDFHRRDPVADDTAELGREVQRVESEAKVPRVMREEVAIVR